MERKFEYFSDFIFDHQKKVIVAILLLVLAMGFQLKHLTMDTSTKGFLTKLEKLHKRLENELPYIEEVGSLINARNTYGNKGSLIVEDLFEQLSKSQVEIYPKKQRALINPLLKIARIKPSPL
ncbi:hypothetical protein [Abyssogena phaseoliformis symbiont]|uniref:hypothetical protein n=1 Tax=Abyssogena phaseoliformis symbiont TaxID=596095 RepID=UPI0019158373|nr:hypothetical protein [Abyssogena phaseoliformis symbiont]